MSHMSRMLNRITRKYGMTVVRRPRLEVGTGDDVGFTWDEDQELRAMVTMLDGIAESWEKPGVYLNADVQMSFAPGTVMKAGDLVKVDNDWYEITESIKRFTGEYNDWVECLGTRRQKV